MSESALFGGPKIRGDNKKFNITLGFILGLMLGFTIGAIIFGSDTKNVKPIIEVVISGRTYTAQDAKEMYKQLGVLFDSGEIVVKKENK